MGDHGHKYFFFKYLARSTGVSNIEIIFISRQYNIVSMMVFILLATIVF